MAMAKCATCSGKGIVGTIGKPCLACGGDGYVNVPDPATPCGRCEGTGSVTNEVTQETSTCAGCDGSGWAT